ncbi:MAG: DUF1015 domain-containing protein [Acidobacteriia bacterium]|nr:DUF1015 domain-containing protein [Terriglobia bacterium]
MARIAPFRALMYDPHLVGDLAQVVTQPYDKISDAMRERYYAANEYNLVRIILGKSLPNDSEHTNVYTRGQEYLNDWIASGVLKRIPKPAFFAYDQTYEVPGEPAVYRTRKGLIGLGHLEDYSSGTVFPHEDTLSGPKEDRLRLLRATRTHFGQIFMLYSDPAHSVSAALQPLRQEKPPLEITDEYRVKHSLWPVEEASLIQSLQKVFAHKQLIIADGHHRYETTLNFRNECRANMGTTGPDAPHEWVMMTFINLDDEGLTILPTHRLVVNLPKFDMKEFIVRAQELFNLVGFKFFSQEEKHRKFEEFRRELKWVGEVTPTLGLRAATTSNFYLMKLKATVNLQALLPELSEGQRKLDVIILHRLILEHCLGITVEDVRAEKYIRYVREMEAGLEAVDQKKAQMCFLLNPTRIDQVRDIALAGGRLPQKSTDFYPKLLSGLTMYSLDAG